MNHEDLEITPISLPTEAWQPERRSWVLENYLTTARKTVAESEKSVVAVREKLDAAQQKQHTAAAAMQIDEAQRKAADAAVAESQAEFHAAYLAMELARAESLSVQRRAEATRALWRSPDNACKGSKSPAQEVAAEAVAAERRSACGRASAAEEADREIAGWFMS